MNIGKGESASADDASQGLKDVWEYTFSEHQSDAVGKRKIRAIRSAARAMANAYIDIVPPGRGQAIALTHLQESLQQAVDAIAAVYVKDQNNDTPDEDKALAESQKVK